MGDAGTLGNGMRCDRNRRDRQLSTARTAAVKVIPRFVPTVPPAICAPIPKTAQRLYRGLSQVSNRVKIKFAAMNLKNWPFGYGWRSLLRSSGSCFGLYMPETQSTHEGVDRGFFDRLSVRASSEARTRPVRRSA